MTLATVLVTFNKTLTKMATPSFITVLNQINNFIKNNSNNEITGAVLNQVLKLLLDFSNNNIGNLSNLATTSKNSVVESINSLNQKVESITTNGIQLHSGFDLPNITPPPAFNYGDFYILLDQFSQEPLLLYQWDGFNWLETNSSNSVANYSDVEGENVTDALNALKNSLPPPPPVPTLQQVVDTGRTVIGNNIVFLSQDLKTQLGINSRSMRIESSENTRFMNIWYSHIIGEKYDVNGRGTIGSNSLYFTRSTNEHAYWNLGERVGIFHVAAVEDLSTKADLVNGLVPTSQLPSFVDDVLEFANFASFPATGESGKLYLDLSSNEIYRWSGSVYIKMSSANPTIPTLDQVAKAGAITNEVITLGDVYIDFLAPRLIQDGHNNVGYPNNILSMDSTGLKLQWIDPPTPITPNLQQVLDAGSNATGNIELIGTITATNSITAESIYANNLVQTNDLYLFGGILAGGSGFGSQNDVLISTGSGTQWQDLYSIIPRDLYKSLEFVATGSTILDIGFAQKPRLIFINSALLVSADWSFSNTRVIFTFAPDAGAIIQII